MTERDFVYWLQGFLELNRVSEAAEPLTLNSTQVNCIQNHLNLVLNKGSEVNLEYFNVEGDTSGAGGFLKLSPKQDISTLVERREGTVKINC